MDGYFADVGAGARYDGSCLRCNFGFGMVIAGVLFFPLFFSRPGEEDLGDGSRRWGG